MNHPPVSVIVPAYNAEAHLAEALESVLAQSYRPMDVIVVDDGSTDRTAEIVKRFSEVRYVSQQNSGPSAARNRGIALAQADYVAFLDADDVWEPEKLSEQMSVVQEHGNAGLVFADMRHFEECQETQPSMFSKYGLNREFFGDRPLVKDAVAKLVRANFIPTSSVLANKQVVLKAGGFDAQLRKAEDWDLWLRMALLAPVGYSPKVLVKKRVHAINVSHDAEGMNVAAVEVLEKFARDHRAEIATLGVDMTGVLRDAYRNLGYFYIRQSAVGEARVALRRSLSFGFQPRSLLYFLSTLLGRRLVGSLVRARG